MEQTTDRPCCHEAHENIAETLREQLGDETQVYDLAEFFKTLGDSTRMRILNLLRYGEVCVCDIAETLSMTTSAVSHQLRVLRGAKLVKGRRDGKSIFYSLDDLHVNLILDMGLAHLKEESHDDTQL